MSEDAAEKGRERLQLDSRVTRVASDQRSVEVEILRKERDRERERATKTRKTNTDEN